MELKIGQNHLLRKDLFARGLRQGFLTVEEVEHALPPGCMTPSERWLLYFSLRAAQVEIRGEPPPELLEEHGGEERVEGPDEQPTARG